MIGTNVSRRDRPAENSGRMSKGGMVPSSSQNSTTRFFSLPPFSSATANNSLDTFWIMSPAIKFLLGSSSGRIRKMADFLLANVSASMLLSKHNTCSNSLSRNAFKRDSTVDRTDAIACSEVFSAAPANQRALCSEGSLFMRTWNWLLPLFIPPAGSKRSCTSLNTETMWRRSRISPSISLGGKNSASRRITEVRRPSAES